MWSEDRPWLAYLLLGLLLLAMLMLAAPSEAEDNAAPDLWQIYWQRRAIEAQERQAEALERQSRDWLLWQPAPQAPRRAPAAPPVPDGKTWCVGDGPQRRCY